MNEISFIGNTFLVFAKYGMIFFLFIYLIFAIIVVRQVKTMTETLKVGFETPIKTLSLIHLSMAFLVFLISFFIL